MVFEGSAYQENVPPLPLALNVGMASFRHIDSSAATGSTSGLTTVTVIDEVALEQLFWSVTVRVYIVVDAGEATGFARLGSFNPVVGLQLYV